MFTSCNILLKICMPYHYKSSKLFPKSCQNGKLWWRSQWCHLNPLIVHHSFMLFTLQESQVIRISFSNMFKEFKSTATWVQFPFLCGAAKGSVYENTAKAARHGKLQLLSLSSVFKFFCSDNPIGKGSVLICGVFNRIARFGGSGPSHSALDLPVDGPAVCPLRLPEPPPQPPEKHKTVRQHVCEEHVHQRPAVRPRWGGICARGFSGSP